MKKTERFYFRGTQRQFSENIRSEDDLRSRIFGTVVVKISCLPASPRIFEHLKHGHNFLKPIIIGSRLRDEPWGLHFSFVVLHVPHKKFESVGVSLALCYRLRGKG